MKVVQRWRKQDPQVYINDLNEKMAEELPDVRRFIASVEQFVVAYSPEIYAKQYGIELKISEFDLVSIQASQNYNNDPGALGDQFPLYAEALRTIEDKHYKRVVSSLARPWHVSYEDSKLFGTGVLFGNGVSGLISKARFDLQCDLMLQAQKISAVGVVNVTFQTTGPRRLFIDGLYPSVSLPQYAQGYALILKRKPSSPHREEQ